MKSLSLKLPDNLDARLAGLARRRGISKSELVREAIEGHLERGAVAVPGSIGDLARDLAGCVEGPVDLSTNPKYMNGFGE